MKSFSMFKLTMIAGLGAAALFLSPASKAQEVSSEHFTDTGVQGVYENASVKPAASMPRQTVQSQARNRSNSAAIVQTAERTPVLPAKKTGSSNRKSSQASSKKP